LKTNVLVLHGPNLNLLGEREPAVYGTTTLKQVDGMIKKKAASLGMAVKCFQSNSEGTLIDLIHKHRKWAKAIVINPGAYTHYSYALRDAIASVSLPCVEVHLSDVTKREPFRRVSVIEEVCAARRFGKGPQSYLDALEFLAEKL
jgi:3-dehydroquinate dehydratase II